MQSSSLVLIQHFTGNGARRRWLIFLKDVVVFVLLWSALLAGLGTYGLLGAIFLYGGAIAAELQSSIASGAVVLNIADVEQVFQALLSGLIQIPLYGLILGITFELFGILKINNRLISKKSKTTITLERIEDGQTFDLIEFSRVYFSVAGIAKRMEISNFFFKEIEDSHNVEFNEETGRGSFVVIDSILNVGDTYVLPCGFGNGNEDVQSVNILKKA